MAPLRLEARLEAPTGIRPRDDHGGEAAVAPAATAAAQGVGLKAPMGAGPVVGWSASVDCTLTVSKRDDGLQPPPAITGRAPEVLAGLPVPVAAGRKLGGRCAATDAHGAMALEPDAMPANGRLPVCKSSTHAGHLYKVGHRKPERIILWSMCLFRAEG